MSNGSRLVTGAGQALPRSLAGTFDDLVREARDYSFDFYRWRKAFELKKHYQVHTKQTCPRDGHRVSYVKFFGTARRRAFFCNRRRRLSE